MKQPIDVTLTGSDYDVAGTAKLVRYPGYSDVYEFTSDDDTLHLIIGRDTNGDWRRIAGTDPYFSGWVDELAEQITKA